MTLNAGTPTKAISPTVCILLFPKCLWHIYTRIDTQQANDTFITIPDTLYTEFIMCGLRPLCHTDTL